MKGAIAATLVAMFVLAGAAQRANAFPWTAVIVTVVATLAVEEVFDRVTEGDEEERDVFQPLK